MNRRHRRTLPAVFEHPTRPDIRWADIEALLLALGQKSRRDAALASASHFGAFARCSIALTRDR
jgi:hypothetical protein